MVQLSFWWTEHLLMHLICFGSTPVSAMPTFLFIKKGEIVDRLMGANPARLQELIEEHK